MKKLLLIDGSSLLHRAFYALPLLSNNDGVFTNAVHGFMMMFNRMVAAQKPDLLAVAFDKSRVTFRNEMFAAYKGTRAETPSELRGQFELIKEVLDAAHVRWLELDGFEADDILGTLAKRGATDGLEVEIFSGDRDILQLIDAHTTVFLTRRGISEIDRYDEAAVQGKYSVTPPHLADLKGLMGDSSDNIPGVPGVGEKTAVKLLSRFGDLDNLYARLDEVESVKLREKLQNNRDAAYLSRDLATIRLDAPLEMGWETFAYDAAADKTALIALYDRLGLRQLLRGLTQSAPAAAMSAAADDRPWPDAEEAAAAAQLPEHVCGLLLDGHKLAIAAHGVAPALLDLDTADAGQLAPYRALLGDAAVAKTAAEAKEIIKLLAKHGVTLAGLADDVTLAAYLLDPARGSYPVEALLAENNLEAGDAPARARQLPALAGLLRGRLQESAMLALYTDMELPLVPVLAAMELRGIRVEQARLAAMSEELAAACDSYQAQIYALAGHAFNLNSPKQLGAVLFEELGIPPLKKTKTGYSTDAEVLETLALTQPIARHLLDYRLVSKLKSTYTDGLGKLIAVDGKIHTSFTQTVTATGRLSSVEPNLQNIPVRHELGRKIREVFTADGPDDLLLAADYNQIELRVLAHISGDEKLRQAYLNGEDIHTRTAAEVLGVEPSAITPTERRAAKAVNFGIVYGISDYGLSRDLGIPRKEAQAYIEKYFARYPGVAAYQKRTIEAARACGYVETMFGRRRYLPDLNSRNFNLRSFAERMAINAPIQGSAADIIKLAMIAIDRELAERGLAARMLLQVHDELIFNVPAAELPAVAALVRARMEGAVSLALPLAVDVKAGHDWYHMEKINA